MNGRRSFIRRTGASALGLLALSGCLNQGPVAETNEVKITDEGFEPKNARTGTESPLMFQNTGSKVHVVTSASDNWEFEKKIEPGKGAAHKFATSGVFEVTYKNADYRAKIAVGDAEIEEPVE